MSATSGHNRTSTSFGAGLVNAVRRIGRNPIGRTPARAAMSSHHAPAAFTTISASYTSDGVVTTHVLPELVSPTTRDDRRISPPRARIPWTNVWCSAATSMSIASGSSTAMSAWVGRSAGHLATASAKSIRHTDGTSARPASAAASSASARSAAPIHSSGRDDIIEARKDRLASVSRRTVGDPYVSKVRGCRPSGRVVGELFLLLEEHDRGVGRQLVGGRDAGDAASDHHRAGSRRHDPTLGPEVYRERTHRRVRSRE
jgi:hypothetical protein